MENVESETGIFLVDENYIFTRWFRYLHESIISVNLNFQRKIYPNFFFQNKFLTFLFLQTLTRSPCFWMMHGTGIEDKTVDASFELNQSYIRLFLPKNRGTKVV